MVASGAFAAACGCDLGTPVVMRRQHPMIPGEVYSGPWHQGRKPGNEVDRLEHDLRGAVAVGSLERVDDFAVCAERRALAGDRWPGDVAAEALAFIALMRLATDARVQGEPGYLGLPWPRVRWRCRDFRVVPECDLLLWCRAGG